MSARMWPLRPFPEDDESSAVAWMERALCAEIGGDYWHPEPGGGGGKQAKMICRRCPVTAECLEYGFNDQFGIYGGLTAEERKQMRRKQREAA